jgi:motility quorum-sensing regulator/GCU-specific mRNA interferase toxin
MKASRELVIRLHHPIRLKFAIKSPIMGVQREWMEKLKPRYELAKIKAVFADTSSLNRTYSSKQGANELDMDDVAVVAVIQSLRPSDFDKSMTSMADHRIWQDVYKPEVGGQTLYVKFTLDAQQTLLLISFKEA